MRSVAGVEPPGCEHVALLHRGSDDLPRLLAPSLHRAADERAAVLLCVDADVEQRLKTDLGSVCDGFTFRPAANRYSKPGVAMADLHRFVVDAASTGAPAVWSIGAIPLSDDGRDGRWIRYEEAVIELFADRPLRAVCLYDAETTPAAVREGVLRTHQSTAGEWLGGHAHDAPPLSSTTTPTRVPDVLLNDPTPRAVRSALAERFSPALLGTGLTDLQLAASELITNAVVHGTPPVEFRAWWGEAGCVLQVRDSGTARIDPYADLRACVGGAHGGFGLWTVGQLADSVEIDHDEHGNTVMAFVAAG